MGSTVGADGMTLESMGSCLMTGCKKKLIWTNGKSDHFACCYLNFVSLVGVGTPRGEPQVIKDIILPRVNTE